MKKIVTLSVLALAVLLAGCNEEKPTPKTEKEIKDANNKLMYIAPRELPTPPPLKKSGQ